MLVNNPYESLVDLEDEEYCGKLEIKRFYSHTSDWKNYVECDARFAAMFPSIEQHENLVDTLKYEYSNNEEYQQKFYMRTIDYNDQHDILRYEVWLNGIKIEKKEQSYLMSGREFEWEWTEIKMGQ